MVISPPSNCARDEGESHHHEPGVPRLHDDLAYSSQSRITLSNASRSQGNEPWIEL
jgi:hypothetical protein